MKTTIKERLEKLDYSQAYDLWNLWVLQNAEPPDKWLLIHELSDLAAMDEDAAAELSDEINKLLADEDEETSDKPKPEIESPIIVSIRDGCVYAVDNVPSDKTIEVHDYDTDGCEDDKIKYDTDGDEYVLSVY